MKRFCIGLFILIANRSIAQDSTKNEINAIQYSGYLEAYYSYDFNKPADNNRPSFIYNHNRHNEFNVNLAFIKGAYNKDRVRANLSFAAGSYMNANYAAEAGVLKNMLEADVGYKWSTSRNFWMDIGIMPSHIGFESAISKDCWTVTRSMLAENTPFFEGGIRFTFISNSGKWLISALALNGWQRITRLAGNSLISWGTQVQYKPNDKLLVNYSTFLGTDKPDSIRKWRYYHNLYGVFQLTGAFGLTFGFDYAQEQKNKNSNTYFHLFSPVGIIRITNKHWALSVRGEYYNDPNGILIFTGSPDGFKTIGLSANIDYLPKENVMLRLEGKTYNSKDNIFIKNNLPVNSNTAITFSTSIAF